MNTEDKIRKQLADHPVIIYMKGTPEAPQCGFSAKASGILRQTGVEFAYVNVLNAPFIMERLPNVSNFPTFPQLFIQGEIIGGSDIVEEMFNNGELVPMLQSATATAE